MKPQFIYAMLIFKVPVYAGLWVLWRMAKNSWQPEPAQPGEHSGDDGGSKRGKPKWPKGPRRGPHGGDTFAPPKRVRRRKRVKIRQDEARVS